jgi:rod shape-determining protein MreD
MRRLSLWILVLVLLVLQVTLFRRIEIWGVRPDAVIVVLVYVALAYGPVVGSTFGFFICLAEYSILSSEVASLPLAGTVIGYLVGRYGTKIMYESYLVQIVIIFVAVIVFDVINYIWLGSSEFWAGFFRYTVPGALYTALAGVVVAAIIERIGGLRIIG